MFTGWIRHRPYIGAEHHFQYDTCMTFFDTRSPPTPAKGSVYRRQDYMGDTSINLDKAGRSWLLKKTGLIQTGNIFLLTQLSSLGYCFNPISLYLVFSEDNCSIQHVIATVTKYAGGRETSLFARRSLSI
jgi:DUF1365 family protein